ncbi:MAG: hypothetical protein AAGD05_17800 [Bacteroidota bacterium]
MKCSRELFLLLCCCLWACQDLPEEIIETPVFAFEGQLAAASLQLTAGEENYFMFTDFTQDESGVHTFSGQLAKLPEDCTSNCLEALRFNIRNFESLPLNAAVDIDNALRLGNYDFDPGIVPGNVTTRFLVEFDNRSLPEDALGSVFLWEFPDSMFSDLENPVDTFETLGFPVTLTTVVDTFEFCTSTYTRLVAANNTGDGCGVGFITQASPTAIFISATPEGGAPFSYEWSDGSTGMDIQVVTPGVYCVDVVDAFGCQSFNCVNVVELGTVGFCAADFGYDISVITEGMPGDSLRLGTVSIDYIDPSGQLYSSSLGPQNSDRFFEIIAIDDFENNADGHPTKKLTVRLNATLFSANGDSLLLQSNQSVIAVAYP